MKQLFFYAFLIAFLSGILQYFLPWWTVAVVAALIGVAMPFKQKRQVFLCGFMGIALLWLAYVLWIDLSTWFVLSPKIARLLLLPGSSVGLWLLTVLVGGTTGGLGALCGNALRQIITGQRREKTATYYY